MNGKTRKLVLSSMLAAMVCVATMIIKIPSPLKGYLNLGDCFVLISGWLLGPVYGFFAAGTGSGLADFFSGYTVYVPATFFIKGIMALSSFYIYKVLSKGNKKILPYIVSGIAAEIIMVVLYYIFEGFMYGFWASLINIPANIVQGIFGIIIGTLLISVFKKSKIDFN